MGDAHMTVVGTTACCELALECFLQQLERTAEPELGCQRGKYWEWESSRDGSREQRHHPCCGGFPVRSEEVIC